MNSLILSVASRLLVALMLLFSAFMLLRGHNAPGGGFIGGLIAATGLAVYAIADGCAAARRVIYFDPPDIAVAGLGLALLAGLSAIVFGDPWFTGQWWFIDTGDGSKGIPLSTVLLFDVGVYLCVLGAVLTFVFAFEESV